MSRDSGIALEAAEDERPTGTYEDRPTGRSTAIFAVWTGLSRVVGLAREILAAAMFGTQGNINAFVIAFNVPNVIRSLVADSALSAALIPVGYLVAGMASDAFGPSAVFLAGGLVSAVILAAMTLLPQIRALD